MENIEPNQDYQPNAITARAIEELESGQDETFHAETFADFEAGHKAMAMDIEREKEAKEWINGLFPKG